MNPGHQPQRFETYNELPNGTGFTIPGSQHVFLFDRYGGWFDQYGNYYNEHGEPDDLPSSSDSRSHSDSEGHSSSSSNSDPYEAEFGRPGYLSDDEDEMHEQEGASLAKNLYNLHSYPQEQLLRVYFRNLPFRARKEELLKAYNQHADGGILNAIIDTDEDGKPIGTGYFITKPLLAQKIIRLQGKRFLDRPLFFQIEEYQNFIVFPVTERELANRPAEKPKKYVAKQQPKPEEPPKPVEAKWRWYKFEKALFPKKTDFRNWMSERGFNAEQDFRNIEKIENDPQKRFVKVEMKESAFAAVNGLPFAEHPVQFFPL